ncbi:MAG: phosphatidate cytidylyltransferase [Gemmatimonadota bacterium]|nr:phosphatidate cytidylyltransferase [Gemmatimonadota bacterium]MDE2871600.1 phosphatidate cytidylyltransferase [Gemmatimonadota bacterium]
MMSAELRARVLVAAVGIPLAFLLIRLGGWYLAGLMAVAAALAAKEFLDLAAAGGGRPLRWLGIPAASALVVLAGLEPGFAAWGDRALALLVVVGLAASCSVTAAGGIDRAPLLSAAATVSGVVYTGGTLSFVVLLRHLPETQGAVAAHPWEGTLLVSLPLAVTWVGDTAAYFVGKRMGKRPLAPRVSPNKTIEGGVAGLIAAPATGALMGVFLQGLPNFPVSPLAGAAVGLVLGAGAQLGDLAESVLKREAGVKDSGALLPGHGGVLDRFDALFFTIPLGYGLILLARHLP